MVYKSACFLLVVLMTAGCLDEPDCFHLNNDIIGIDFKKIEDSSTDTVAIDTLATLEPGILFLTDTAVRRLNLPLNYFEDETTFLLMRGDTLNYLRLGYTSQAQFVSENCGEKFILSQLRILDHNFDSIRLVRDVPTSEGGIIHIEIFQ